MAHALTHSLSGIFPQNLPWERILGVAIMALLVLHVLSAPMTYACPA